MGLANVLFGRKKLKDPARERLFALSTAQVTLNVELGLKPAGAAAVVFKPLSAGEFVRAENELQALLDKVAQESGSRVERKSDEFGYEWLIIRDNELEDQVSIRSTGSTGTSAAPSGLLCRPARRSGTTPRSSS